MGALRVTIVVLACAIVTIADELYPLSDDFIDHVNSKQTSWKAGRNFPYNTPLKHIKKLLGVLPTKRVSSLPTVKHDEELIASLPETFDSRDKWPECPSLNEIRDQGNCGSCWAIAAVEVMTDRVCIYSNGTKQFHFSAEDVITCCSSECAGCDGGSYYAAFHYWEEHGIVSGGNYNSSEGCKSYTYPPSIQHNRMNAVGLMPYYEKHSKNPMCLETCDKSYGIDYEKDKIYGKSFTVFSKEAHIMAELYLHGPVKAIFKVHLDFINYKSGVYFSVVKCVLGSHAVKIIGWGVENGTKYWLAANSWNSRWGDNGFFKIRRGNNECSIESTVLSGEPIFD